MSFVRIPNLVSIVIGCYNKGQFIEETLNSLIAQTYKNIEIILINDASTDQSDQVIRNWKRKNQAFTNKNRFIYLTLPHNTGYAGAFTTGHFLARGEFIAIQDADDLSHPQRIEKQVQFMRHNPDVGMVGTDLNWFDDGKFDEPYRYDFVKYGRENITKLYAEGEHCTCHGTTMVRGELFDQLGGFERYPRKRETMAEDYYKILKYVRCGVKIDNIPEVLYYYRRYPEQRSQNGIW